MKLKLTGISILLILAISYFIRFETESGSNFITETKLLSILIFRNPIILTIYIFIGITLIFVDKRFIKANHVQK